MEIMGIRRSSGGGTVLRFHVEAFIQNDNTNNEIKRMRYNNYIISDYSDILRYRALEQMPIDHDLMIKLKEKGHVRKDFGKGFWFVFRVEKLDEKTQAHLSRLKINKKL